MRWAATRPDWKPLKVIAAGREGGMQSVVVGLNKFSSSTFVEFERRTEKKIPLPEAATAQQQQ